MAEFEELRARLREFAAERDWEQFHSPRNLAMALAGEVGELLAELQWVPDSSVGSALSTDAGLRVRVADEVADVLIYLTRFSDVAGIDLLDATMRKIAKNEERYPPDRVRGSAAKYDRQVDPTGRE